MRTKQEIQADIKQKEAELAALQQELHEASIEVWVAIYDVRDDSQAVVGLMPYDWVDAQVLGLHLFFTDKKGRKEIQCAYQGSDSEPGYYKPSHVIQVDQGAITREDDCVHMRAFTSKDKAEACLDLWIRTAGMSEYE